MQVNEVNMLDLTQEQRQQLRQAQGEAIRLRDPEAQREYVLVPVEVYDRLKSVLYDNSDWTPEEQLRLLADSGGRAGWDDPEMDVYDNYDQNQKKLCP
jgi:hypothetical protein